MRKNIGYRSIAIGVEEMEQLADDIAVLRDDLFRVGWNATVAKQTGADLIQPRQPGDTVNGVNV
ncbi:hypothetical protein ACWC2H_36040 [Streptomyces sp. 900105755]